MASSPRTPGRLSARIVRLTLVIGAVTIGIAVIAAIISTSRLTAETDRNRDLRAIQAVEDSIENHLRSCSTAIEQASRGVRDIEGLRERLDVALDARQGDIEEIVVADRRGRVIAQLPASAPERRSVRRLPAFLSALAGQPGYISSGESDGEWELWLARAAITPAGEPLLVLARLDTDFVQRFVDQASAEVPRRTLVVMDGPQVIAEANREHQMSFPEARWAVLGPQWGSVRVRASDGVLLQGHYNDVGGLEGLSLRAVIVTPATEQALDTLRTVAPPVLVLLAGGFVALVVAWAVSQRLSRPLRDLERAALAAASGSYVRQLSTDRDDEVGRVAQAFNAVALRLNALHDMSQLLASTSSLDQVLEGVLEATGHLAGPGSAAIFLLEHDGELLVPVKTRGRELAEARSVPVAEAAWLTEALASSGPMTFQGTEEDLDRELPGVRTSRTEVLAAPLVVGVEALGVVAMIRDADVPLSDAENEMLRTFSAQAAVAVQTSRLFEYESRARRNAEALRLVAEELVRPASLQSALNTVETIIAELFSVTDSMVAVEDRSVLGLSTSNVPDIEQRVIEVAREALSSQDPGEPLVVKRGWSEQGDSLLHELGAERILMVPIALDTDHGAVLCVPLSDDAMMLERMEFGRAIGDEIALALDNAYFYQRAVSRAANLETIFRISQAVGSSLQINVVLNRVLDVVQKILSAEAVALMLFDSRTRSLSMSMGRGAVPSNFVHLDLEPGEDVPGQVFERGEPVAIRDLSAFPDGVARMAADNDLRSMLAVPLLARGRSIGVLMVFTSSAGAFTDEDLNTLQTFASQAALAIDTARLYSHEHEVASVLQQSILPEALPDFAEVTAGSVYAPAGGDIEIGGDYYDLFRGPDESIWFAIADVCGKGVYAATKTTMIKYSVRALSLSGRGPADVVREVNNIIAESGDPSDIVTLWLGRYDAASGQLSWADGGHPPGLLRRADGHIERLEVTGALLGAAANAHYDEAKVSIGPGDRILLYTDGVTEARRGNIFFGEQRVREVLEQPGSVHQTARSLLAAVRAYVAGELRDDIAVLVLEPNGPATGAEQELHTG